MKKRDQKLSSVIKEKSIREVYEKNFQHIASEWLELQMYWVNHSYRIFRDHDKYLIIIYILKKTFDQYAKSFITLNFNDFYSVDKIEIEKLNVIEISQNLHISKETTRRKIAELQKNGTINKFKKKLLVNKEGIKHTDPKVSLKKIVSILSNFSVYCAKDKIFKNELTKDQIEKVLLEKFSYTWKLWYEMLIENSIEWKKIYGDLETFHILGSIIINESYETIKNLKKNKQVVANHREWISSIRYLEEKKTGINTMSISQICGIPRATVIRKLKILLKNRIISVDKKKLFKVNKENFLLLENTHKKIIGRLSIFTTQIFNLIKFN